MSDPNLPLIVSADGGFFWDDHSWQPLPGPDEVTVEPLQETASVTPAHRDEVPAAGPAAAIAAEPACDTIESPPIFVVSRDGTFYWDGHAAHPMPPPDARPHEPVL